MTKFLLSALLWVLLGSFLTVLLAVFIAGWITILADDAELKESGTDLPE